MLEEWTGSIVAKMHINRITQEEVAKRIGIRRDYLNKILNGKKSPKGAESRINEAIDSILTDRNVS